MHGLSTDTHYSGDNSPISSYQQKFSIPQKDSELEVFYMSQKDSGLNLEL